MMASLSSLTSPTLTSWSNRTAAAARVRASKTPEGWDAAWIEAVLAHTGERDVLSSTLAHFQFSRLPVALCSAAVDARSARILWINPAFTTLTGLSAKDAIGESALLLAGAQPDDIHLAEVELLHTHPDQMPFGIVTAKQRNDGSWYHVEEHIMPLSGSGRLVGPKQPPTHFLIAQIELPTPASKRSA